MRFAISLLVSAAVFASALASDTGHKDSYVLRDSDITYMLGEGMSADSLKALQARFGREFLWARRGGRTFVIRDEDALDRARAVVQRNVPRAVERDRRMAGVVDDAVRRGVARAVR